MRRRALLLFAPLLLALGPAGCGGGASDSTTTATVAPASSTATETTAAAPPARARTIDVPRQARTINAAIALAGPGSLIRIAPGVYHEAVVVPAGKRDIVLRGLDRNRTVLDGQNEKVTGLYVHAPGVAVENLTVRRYVGNGLVFAPDPDAPGADAPAGTGPYGSTTGPTGAGGGALLDGYRASYVTAADNGLYGVYAFAATHGEIDHVYASGHPDSGVYVGQCQACQVLVTDSRAEHNMVGYEGTNASGVTVTRSSWSHNRVGVALNSQDKERFAPASGVVLTDNVVAANDDRAAPRGSDSFGIGVVLSGAQRSQVAGNRVSGNPGPGILLDQSIDGYVPDGDEVRANRLSGNGTDLALRLGGARSAPASLHSCFAENRFRSSSPTRIEQRLPCPRGGAVALPGLRLPPSPRDRDYTKVPLPAPQPQLPNASTAPARPAADEPDTAAIRRARRAIP